MDTKDLIGQWKLRNGNYLYIFEGKPDPKIVAERNWSGVLNINRIGQFYDEAGRHKAKSEFDIVERRRGEEIF